MIETLEELQSPGALRRAVAELGARVAAAGEDTARGLAAPTELAAPPMLDLLFRLALGSALRRGPAGAAETGSPGELLAAAARAAAGGGLPLATVAALRGSLERLEADLREAGLWAPEAPFWWSPLLAPGPLETLRRGMEEGSGLALPAAEELAAALSGPGWIAWPEAVPRGLLDRIAGELAQASAGNGLDLEAGGVGASGERSARRTDSVRYLGGLEPDLLARAPALAVLAQHLLDDLEAPLRRALPERSLFAPRAGMLARYRAPSGGFAAHLDNAGGAEDNRRALALVVYLNPPDAACRGGELALWAPGSSTEAPPAACLPAAGGSAVLFDARTVPHAVRPLEPGPDRWTLVVWLSERRQRPPRPLLPVPEVTRDEVLLAVDEPPVVPGTVVFRRPSAEGGPERLAVRRLPAPAAGPARTAQSAQSAQSAPSGRRARDAPEGPRVGIVATVAGAGDRLEAWCRHHLDLGFERLLLVFDRAEEPEEAACARRLAGLFGDRVTVWSDAEARRWWRRLPPSDETTELLRLAAGGAATWAVAARQALNASAALLAAGGGRPGPHPGRRGGRPLQASVEPGGLKRPSSDHALSERSESSGSAGAGGGGPLPGPHPGLQAAWFHRRLKRPSSVSAGAGGGRPGAPLDWLLHLDADELFCLEGAGRGGASLAEHFAAASAEGWTVLRYLNHELLLPWRPGERPRFKRNPVLAAARLGPEGWRRLARCLAMEQGDRRPYFRAYWNGKSAVAVAAGRAAAGVHAWRAAAAAGPGGGPEQGPEEPLLAGPSILHFHQPTAAAFRRKYLEAAAAADGGRRPFPPSALELAAVSLIRELGAAGTRAAEIDARLDELYAAVTAFSAAEIELLDEAGLLFAPALEHAPLPGAPAAPGPPGDRPAGGEAGASGPSPSPSPWVRELDRAAERRRLEAAERSEPRTLSGTGSRAGARVEDAAPPLAVGVLGGGTAGYLAALALRAKRPEIGVTLIESRDVPVIGVGEATTPLMPQFLHADLGVGAEELFRAVRPTFKLGIRFLWGRAGASGDGGFPYPFGPLRPLEATRWDGHLDACSLQAVLMAAGALPVEAAAGGRRRAAFGTEIAYHLDNRRLAAFLKRLALARGVEVVEARIERVESASREGAPEVAALVAADGRRFDFDLYLDCSGFRSLLVGEALGSPWVGYEGSLFTDRAVVGAAPHGGRLRPYTEARTMAAGWRWAIAQEEADHVGYVYASAFAGAEEAAAELRRSLVNGGPGVRSGAVGEAELREVRFRSGRREHFWLGNAVALGNSYGFVEPLESTSLHLLIRQLGLLLRALPRRRGEAAPAALLNPRVAAFWDYVRWFLALHFRFNERLDTPFWRACREEVDVSAHGELLELFRERGPLAYDPAARALFSYPDPLWGPEGIDTILLGQGVPCRLPEPATAEAEWRELARLRREAAGRSLRQEEVLRGLGEHPEVLEALEAEFRRRGPAFP